MEDRDGLRGLGTFEEDRLEELRARLLRGWQLKGQVRGQSSLEDRLEELRTGLL